MQALETRIEADLQRGLSGELVGELEELVQHEPLRERPVAQLMHALYRAGRQAEALRSFQRFRRRIDEELGIEPSPELCRLEEQILVHDSRLVPASVATPSEQARAMINPFKGLHAVPRGRRRGLLRTRSARRGGGRANHGRRSTGRPRRPEWFGQVERREGWGRASVAEVRLRRLGGEAVRVDGSRRPSLRRAGSGPTSLDDRRSRQFGPPVRGRHLGAVPRRTSACSQTTPRDWCW